MHHDYGRMRASAVRCEHISDKSCFAIGTRKINRARRRDRLGGNEHAERTQNSNH